MNKCPKCGCKFCLEDMDTFWYCTNCGANISKKVRVVRKRKDGVVQSYWAGNIERLTERNRFFRKVLFTSANEQLVVMSIPVGGSIGREVHKSVDQFFRVEEGFALFEFPSRSVRVGPGGSVIVKKGTFHNVKNVGKVPLKLYTIYSPPNHPKGTIDKTRADAILREGHD